MRRYLPGLRATCQFRHLALRLMLREATKKAPDRSEALAMLVGREGFEPSTKRLKVHNLPSHVAPARPTVGRKPLMRHTLQFQPVPTGTLRSHFM